MNRLKFCGFMDYENGKIARMETLEGEIPLNIFIDNSNEIGDKAKGMCLVDISGIGSDIEIYRSEEAFNAAEKMFASVFMIPIGTFSANGDDKNFKQSPHIMFAGKVKAVKWDKTAGKGKPNCCILLDTLEIEMVLYIRTDKPVKAGCIIKGVAWLFGDMEME